MSFKPFCNFFAAALLLSSCSSNAPRPSQNPVDVSVIEISPKNIPALFSYVAVAQSSHPVEIRARVEGFLDTIGYEEGALVKEGQMLFQLDQKPFEAKLAIANAELASQEARLWQTQRSVQRLKPLYEQKAASQRDLDNAVAAELAATAAVESAKAQVVEATLNLGYTTITTPIAGLSGQANLRQGALVNGAPSSPLLTTISVLHPIWVNFSVSDREMLKARKDVELKRLRIPTSKEFDVTVLLSDGSTFPETGKVDFADPTINRGTGTMEIRSVFPNPEGLLKPGQFVRVILTGAEWIDAIAVPQKAVMQGQDGMFVYVVDKDNKAVIRKIDPGEWVENDWIIKSGLQKGDLVVVEGVNKIFPGSVLKQNLVSSQKQHSDITK